ncbi:MAG: hypothetical protein Q4D62_09330 [Planctomycetia bacterium]|nr:hypothetical protein [Planctomycetia bacterium]
MKKILWRRRTFLLLFLFVMGGCGDGRPRCYPVAGKVLVNGKPLAGDFDGTIRFVWADSTTEYGRPATANIDENGHFSLTTFEKNDGCPLGKYKVELYVFQKHGRKVSYLVPLRYQNAATSDLNVTITGKTTDLTIDAHWLPTDELDRKPIQIERFD